jgi:hypothetical protein
LTTGKKRPLETGTVQFSDVDCIALIECLIFVLRVKKTLEVSIIHLAPQIQSATRYIT